MKASKSCLACGFRVESTTQLSVSGSFYCQKKYDDPKSVFGIYHHLKFVATAYILSDTDLQLLDGGLSQSGFETTEENWNAIIFIALIAFSAILGMAFYCWYCKRKN